jgi:hypothetical protein
MKVTASTISTVEAAIAWAFASETFSRLEQNVWLGWSSFSMPRSFKKTPLTHIQDPVSRSKDFSGQTFVWLILKAQLIPTSESTSINCAKPRSIPFPIHVAPAKN